MAIDNSNSWQRFQAHYQEYPAVQMSLDLSRVDWPEGFLDHMEEKVGQAMEAMSRLEAGSIANPDENRMVGHYWLRNPALAPSQTIRDSIEKTVLEIKEFAEQVHDGRIKGKSGTFINVIVIGIGGSALGPLFVSNALSYPNTDRMNFFILDNTDPDGIDRVLGRIGDDLGRTLSIVISKSGGTKETRNGMFETKMAYEKAGLGFPDHAVAITQKGSHLDQLALKECWIRRFPMWDWVGGRTSELSAVGLLPAALQGFDIDSVIKGAMDMDVLTRSANASRNPAMGMALAWYSAGNGKGDKNLVVLPYKDRLELFSKYLQQLIMESIGKERDLSGKVVNQGLSVFGNKGSTDQHSFVQQLRDGRNDFIVTFIEVLKDRTSESADVEDGLNSGDFLQGFMLGTRHALTESGRESITITIDEVSPYTIGMLIALFERTVGLYASLISINAYHQPGVEAGKKAATEVLRLKSAIIEVLRKANHTPLKPDEISKAINSSCITETVFKICKRLAANPDSGIKEIPANTPDQTAFSL